MFERVFYGTLKWVAIGPWLRLVFRPKYEGRQNVPADGPAILAGNHLSYTDWLFMPLGLKRMVRFVAKAEYFTQPGIVGWFQKVFFAGTGNVPIDRTGRSAAEGALIAAQKVLDSGELFGIYPEGTRSHDGKLYRGRVGVARLAIESGAKVIPVAVIGTNVVAPPGKVFGKVTRPVVRFGEPMDFSAYVGKEGDRETLRAITDEIMAAIHQLSEQEYVDVYASEAKRKAKEAARKLSADAEPPENPAPEA